MVRFCLGTHAAPGFVGQFRVGGACPATWSEDANNNDNTTTTNDDERALRKR